MAKRGRKRKQGARTKSGRLSRAQAHTYDHGTDKAKAKQEQFGNDGSDAIGRAYRTGLLGDGADAKAMLDTARKIATRYKAFYQVGPITCPTADKSTGSGVAISNQETIKRKEWLDRCLDAANGYGRAYRASFDDLVLGDHADSGPAWLDRRIQATITPRSQIRLADLAEMARATEVLAYIAGVNVPVNPTGRKPSAQEMHARVKARYPRTITRLAE